MPSNSGNYTFPVDYLLRRIAELDRSVTELRAEQDEARGASTDAELAKMTARGHVLLDEGDCLPDDCLPDANATSWPMLSAEQFGKLASARRRAGAETVISASA